MVLYYISLEREGEPGEGMMFAELSEIEHASGYWLRYAAHKNQARREAVNEDGEMWSNVWTQRRVV